MEGTIREPRFMREYAQNKSKRIAEEGNSGRRYNASEVIAKITAIEAYYRRGMITLDEAMREISEA